MVWSDQRFIRHRIDGQGLFNETIEQLSASFRFAAVEPECKFIEVVRQMSRRNRALMRPQQPAFQQRSNPVDSRKQLGRGLGPRRAVVALYGNNRFSWHNDPGNPTPPPIGRGIASCRRRVTAYTVPARRGACTHKNQTAQESEKPVKIRRLRP